MTLQLIVAWSAARSLIRAAAVGDYGEVVELRRLLINEGEDSLAVSLLLSAQAMQPTVSELGEHGPAT